MKHFLLFLSLLIPIMSFAQKKKRKSRSSSYYYTPHYRHSNSNTQPSDNCVGCAVIYPNTGNFDCSSSSPKYEKNQTSLKITNGGNLDMVLKIVNLATDETIRTLYIRANDSFTASNIPEGKYYFKEAHGKKWKQKTTNDGKCVGGFSENAVYNKSLNIADFNIIKTRNGRYEHTKIPSYELEMGVRISFDKKDQGNYKSNTISANDFNK